MRPVEDFPMFDRQAVRNAILLALQGGPLEKWRIREVVHLEDGRLLRELQAMRAARLLMRVGHRRQARWQLAGWKASRAAMPAHTKPFQQHQKPIKPVRPPAESWWTKPELQDRGAFQARATERIGERQHETPSYPPSGGTL